MEIRFHGWEFFVKSIIIKVSQIYWCSAMSEYFESTGFADNIIIDGKKSPQERSFFSFLTALFFSGYIVPEIPMPYTVITSRGLISDYYPNIIEWKTH